MLTAMMETSGTKRYRDHQFRMIIMVMFMIIIIIIMGVFFTIFPNSLGGENVNFSLGGERVFLMCRFSPCGEHVNFSPFGENVNFSLGGERIFLMLGFSPSGDKVSFSLIGENRFTY